MDENERHRAAGQPIPDDPGTADSTADSNGADRTVDRARAARRSRRVPARAPARESFSVGAPDDLLAVVPVLLGFVPQESVVMVGCGPGAGPHARADLVPGQERGVASLLVEPALRHGLRTVALVVYTDLKDATAQTTALWELFVAADVDVKAVLVADGRRWVDVRLGGGRTQPRDYDLWNHPFLARAVLAGRVVLGSRDDLARSLAPVTSLVREVTGAERALRRGPVDRLDDPASVRDLVVALTAPEVAGRAPNPRDVARLVRAAEEPSLRDQTWGWVQRGQAQVHTDLWAHVVRGCADDRVAGPASVLAFHAWLLGEGALAHTALDRAHASGPGTSLSRLVHDLLARAVSPALWRPVAADPEDRERRAEDEGRRAPAEVVRLVDRRAAR